MTQEHKELLLKDLCGRLPYRVKCQVREDEFTYIGTLCRLEVDNKNENLLDFAESISGLDCQVCLSEVKPYLFSLSSITVEQIEELNKLLKIDEDAGDWIKANDCLGVKLFLPTGRWVEHLEPLFDWFNKNHFDYRYLIEEGLAIDATGLNVY